MDLGNQETVDALIAYWSRGPKSVDDATRGVCREVAGWMARAMSGVELLAFQEEPEEHRSEIAARVAAWRAETRPAGGGAASGGTTISVQQTNSGGINLGGFAGPIHGGINVSMPAPGPAAAPAPAPAAAAKPEAPAASSADLAGPASPAPSAASALRILFLAANPTDSSRLRLDEEVRAIDRALTAASLGSRCELAQKWAVRVADLQEHLLKVKPHVLHFSGHGGEDGTIALQSESGKTRPVDVERLARLLARFNGRLRCVVLNACYSQAHAEAIAEHIDCVIGMSKEVGDRASIRFASSFYLAVASGCSVEDSFEQARANIELGEMGQDGVPSLLTKRCDPASVVLVAAG